MMREYFSCKVRIADSISMTEKLSCTRRSERLNVFTVRCGGIDAVLVTVAAPVQPILRTMGAG